MILFCLPYAGGSESIFYNWKKYLDSSINLTPIYLKGRGRRFSEELYENIDEAINDIFNTIKNNINEEEYAIYGHSMGSLLAYELYYKIRENNLKEPKHIFFSGYKAPNIIKIKDNIHKLPNYDFINKVVELGGTPKEVFENKELLELFIPILKSDFKLIDNYIFKNRKDKIQCDISILNGKKDSITTSEINEWKNLVDKNINIYNFEGDHFFINDNIENIVELINDILIGQVVYI